MHDDDGGAGGVIGTLTSHMNCESHILSNAHL